MVQAHLSLLLGLTLTALVALRVLAAANFDAVTALAILQNVGVGTVLLTTVIAVIPAVACLAAGITAVGAFLVPARRSWLSAVAVFAGSIALVSAPLTILGSTGLAVMTVVARRCWFRGRSRHGGKFAAKLSAVWDRGTTAALMLVPPMFFLWLQPWLAPEVIEDAGGTARLAFVLDDEPRPVLLDFKTRRVTYLDAPLAHRTVRTKRCPLFDGQTLRGWADRGAGRYPLCSLSVTER